MLDPTTIPRAAGGYRRPDGIWVFAREEFCGRRFHYRKGQHAVFGGPSTKGKTRLARELGAHIAEPDLPMFVAQSKPMDPETRKFVTELHFREVDDWPVTKKLSELWDGKPSGYVITPKFGDITIDTERCAGITARLLADRYSAGAKGQHGILVMDDTMVKAKVLKLDRQMVTILAMGGAMGLSEWIFVQKPTDSGAVTLWGFENAIHCFFTKGGDAKMLTRYAEIAGEHGPMVKAVVPTLKPFQFLYLHRDEGWYCIVDRGQ